MGDGATEVGRRAATRPATAHDVARLAGVSQSAVSRTFTGASVSEGTRERVLDAAKVLNYRLNQAARTLSTDRSFVIGVAVSHLDNQFYPEFLERLSDALGLAGYRILLFVTKGSGDFEPLVEEVLRHRVDALVLASRSLSSTLGEQCVRGGVPVIMFNNIDPASPVSSVAGANQAGGRLIADFLAAGGHRRFGFIAGVDGASTSREREEGFCDRLAELGFDQPARAIGDFSFEGAWAATVLLLERPDRPDALFCANDHMALAALQAASTVFGLKPGHDLSIVGFDNVAIGAWPGFQLTTYSQPMVEMVERTVAQILRLLGGRVSGPIHDRVAGDLIVRGSARRPNLGRFGEAGGEATWVPD